MPLFIVFLVLFAALPPLLWAPAARAETTDDAREQLSGTLSELKASDSRQKDIAAKQARLEKEMKTLQQETVSMARDTGKMEKELSSYEEKLNILEDQKDEKTKALKARQGELSEMISAMVKLQELPPEAVIAMPGKLDETLETARALGVVTHAVEEEAESLKLQIKELDELETKISNSREAIAGKEKALIAKQTELSDKIKQRGQLQAELGSKEHEEKMRAQQLTAKSQNLQELLDSLEKTEHNNAWEHETTPNAVKKTEHVASKHKLRSFENAKGDMDPPASGKIISHFGNTGLGATFSKGIVIETRESASVVAPYDGEVVFAGPFRDYGHMVIIRHSGDYHTLLSGMGHISCTPGQFLLEGEPIGAMGNHAGGTRLYTELRKDGKPVDPLPWFKE
jgi:septal ring factor EnvC (AmiA/AmiB activator)